jgi:hypothetical protein
MPPTLSGIPDERPAAAAYFSFAKYIWQRFGNFPQKINLY